MESDHNFLAGIVFDVSLMHYENNRIIDSLKKILLDFVLKNNVKAYVSHPDWDKIAKNAGESTYFLASYQEPLNFNIDLAIKRAITAIGEDVENCSKYVYLFTDRFYASNNNQYKKSLLFNEIRGYNLKICIIGIGNNYDKISLKSLCDEYNALFFHSDDIQSVSDIMIKSLGE